MILNHKIIGEGEPVIILHGLFGMLDNWQRFAKTLSETHRVILVDQRNHGKSFRSEEFMYDLLAEDLAELMDVINIPAAHMLGHSMGGKTAMTFVHNYPDKVLSFIIVDIAPKTYPGGHKHIFDAVLGIDIEQAQSRKEIDEKLAKTIKEQAVRLFLMKNLKRKKEGGFKWKANFPILYKTYDTIMGHTLSGEVHTPGLFVKGGNSDYIETDDVHGINTYFPKARLVEIEGAGHWVHADKPLVLLAEVRQFLAIQHIN